MNSSGESCPATIDGDSSDNSGEMGMPMLRAHWPYKSCRWLLCAVIVMALSCAQPQVSPIPEGPVSYVGHGAMFDREGKELVPTDEFIERTQEFYLGELLKRATQNQRSRLEMLRIQIVQDLNLDTRSRLVVNALLLDWMIRTVRPAESERLLGINTLLKLHLRRSSPDVRASNTLRKGVAFDIPDALRRRIIEAGLTTLSTSQALTTTAGGAAYRTLCQNSGVPIPPDWGTAQWINRGALTTPFISETFQAEVFTYQSTSPEGVCIALPRLSGNQIQLLGIICLGKASSKACFWDNQENGGQFFPVRGEVVPFDRFAGGNDLVDSVGGICTSCHAGENPFVIHPNTALGLPTLADLPLFPDRWYDPIVKPNWPENPGPNRSPVSTPGVCDGCHTAGGQGGRLPELSRTIKGYCNNVLNSAIARTMPPSAPGSQNADPHVAALLDQCSNAPRPGGDLARFVNQSVAPSPVPPGGSFNISVSFANAGTTRWTGAHKLTVAAPSSGAGPIWNPVEFSLGTIDQPVVTTEEVLRTFTLQAPMQPATYDLAFVLRDPVGRVLATSPQTQVVVAAPNTTFDNAALTISSAPSSLPNGQSATVTVMATNSGTTTWSSPGYILRLDRGMRVSLPQNSVALPGTGVQPAASMTLSFTISCNGQGQGFFTAQLAGPGGRFGQNVSRTVACQP